MIVPGGDADQPLHLLTRWELHSRRLQPSIDVAVAKFAKERLAARVDVRLAAAYHVRLPHRHLQNGDAMPLEPAHELRRRHVNRDKLQRLRVHALAVVVVAEVAVLRLAPRVHLPAAVQCERGVAVRVDGLNVREARQLREARCVAAALWQRLTHTR